MIRNNVTRFILDEAHELLISDVFRPKFFRLWEVALKNCQRIYLSATIPPRFATYFMEKTALHPPLTQWIRGETNRPELRYHIAKIDAQRHCIISVLSNLAAQLERIHFGPKSRGVIFCSNVKMVQDLMLDMDCFSHYSEQKTANEINMERWKDGFYVRDDGRQFVQRWMAATPGLINGIDLDNVDAVLFGEEGMAGLFGGVQGTGRGGRTGHPCMCIVVTSGTFNPPHDAHDIKCTQDMKRWTQEPICRRIVPSGVMDDKSITCEELAEIYPTTELCDICDPHTPITQLIKRAIANAMAPCHTTTVDSLPHDSSSLGVKMRLDKNSVQVESLVGKSSHSSSLGVKMHLDKNRVQVGSLVGKSSHQASKSSKPATQPGMAIIINQALAEDLLAQKYRKTDVLNDCMTLLRDHCYVCWILNGSFKKADHQPIFQCGLGRQGWGMGWQSFKSRYMHQLPRYHFCFGCGLPQNVNNKNFEPVAHTGLGKECNAHNMINLMLFALKRSPHIWKIVCGQFSLDSNMGDEAFADWSSGYTADTAHYYNGLEMVIWFVQKYRIQYDDNK